MKGQDRKRRESEKERIECRKERERLAVGTVTRLGWAARSREERMRGICRRGGEARRRLSHQSRGVRRGVCSRRIFSARYESGLSLSRGSGRSPLSDAPAGLEEKERKISRDRVVHLPRRFQRNEQQQG